MSEELNKNMEQMKVDGITLSDIYEELEYRDQAGDSNRWSDDLFEYSSSELEQIASWWNDEDKDNE